MRYFILISSMILGLVAAATATIYVVNPEGTGDFPTIQEALDACIDGDIIELTDGTFTGDGNRDIDYLGKAITVRSQSGDPEMCTIDCEAHSKKRSPGGNESTPSSPTSRPASTRRGPSCRPARKRSPPTSTSVEPMACVSVPSSTSGRGEPSPPGGRPGS